MSNLTTSTVEFTSYTADDLTHVERAYTRAADSILPSLRRFVSQEEVISFAHNGAAPEGYRWAHTNDDDRPLDLVSLKAVAREASIYRFTQAATAAAWAM